MRYHAYCLQILHKPLSSNFTGSSKRSLPTIGPSMLGNCKHGMAWGAAKSNDTQDNQSGDELHTLIIFYFGILHNGKDVSDKEGGPWPGDLDDVRHHATLATRCRPGNLLAICMTRAASSQRMPLLPESKRGRPHRREGSKSQVLGSCRQLGGIA